MTLPAGTSLGPYEVLAPIGAGGMGEVYRARDPRLGREVAVKVLLASVSEDPDRLRRFEQEARAAGALNHPNVLAVYDVGTYEGTPYVVSELLEGETLGRKMAGSPLPLRKCLDYAIQIARGLAAAHAKGIVHRDLKPENVFVTRDGRVKILDFGLAKLTRREPLAGVSEDATLSTPARTAPGAVVGTVGYMAPEQVGGEPADHRSDIFAFGAIFYEMLFGHRAFKGGTSAETLFAIVKKDPLEVPGLVRTLPPGVERVLRHCLEKSPDERFQSARDLAFDLEALSAPAHGSVAETAESHTRVRTASRDPIPPGGFTPGTVLARRYRIIGPLGRGGMGEVYRADDLKLGQPVALKFLPHALAEDRVRREQLMAEVRIARQIAHPNVCRVYDVAEVDGQQFLSMEYVDGEDLASLVKRIGRLPADKALDITRQICAGLAAAHGRGVLHRDLKPSNVMLDGRGRVRIMDFGLAVAADAAPLEGDASGTPAYMAPEQLAGKGASVRSDIYALGLVLYEVYTGRRAFTGPVDELRARKEQAMPTAPSELIGDMDPMVERIVMRAVDPDPRARPASVAQVAAALPGGTLLQAVLQAGETPSPDLVAASGTNEGLDAPRAWALLALVVAGAVAAYALGSKALLWRGAALEPPPDSLAVKARATLERLGYSERPLDQASGFEADLDYLRYLQTHEPSRSAWTRASPSFRHFWYRQSPHPLESWRFTFSYGNFSRVNPADPPLDVAGMTLVRLEPTGRLVQLIVVPSPLDEAGGAAPTPDWPALLAAVGFEPSDWKPVAPLWTPPVYADARAAWQGPRRPDLPLRLEAAAFRGQPVYFQAVYPWTRAVPTVSSVLTPGERAALALVFFVAAAMILGAAIFARRNLRAGRGDRRGASRLSAFVFTAMFVAWFFGESHVATLWEVALVMMALSWAVLTAGLCWLGYLAAEPFVRRHSPDVLVSWARVLAGEYRDPLVGRDVLIGCAGGTALAVVGFVGLLVPEWLGLPPDIVPADVIGVAYGLQTVVPLLVWRLAQSVIAGLAPLFLVSLLRLGLHSQWMAVVACILLASAPGLFVSQHVWVSVILWASSTGVLMLLLLRAGLLAAVAAFYTSGLFVMFPVTVDLSSWYAGAGVTALLVFGALALFGFMTALAGRPALGGAALEQ